MESHYIMDLRRYSSNHPKIFFNPTRFWTSAPLSLLKNSVFYDPKDSTTILDTEFSLLSQKMPQDLHNKLTSLLQDISD